MIDDIDKLCFEEKIKLAISTDINKLTILSKDSNWYIRSLVAGNTNTPVEILSILAKDTDTYVRYYVVQNFNTPIEVLKKLINDEDEYIKEAAINRLVELKGLNCFA